MTEERLSLQEAARQLGVSRVTIWRWAKDGKFHAFRFGGRNYTTQAAIDAFRRQQGVSLAEANKAK